MDAKELKELQLMPMEWKVIITKARLRDAIVNFGVDGLYLSLSGGKDSLVLHWILKEVEYQDYGGMVIPRVFCNTGLEYPEVREGVLRLFEGKSVQDKLVVLKPDMHFRDVITKYGYPIISKEQSQFINQYRNAKSEKTKHTRLYGNKWGRGKISEKWKYLIDSDFKISDKCCDIMKKKPFKEYEKKTGRAPILGKMAVESAKRMQDYIKQGGCNAFDNKRPKSEPIGFWTEQDILEYIYKNNITIPSVYGEILYIDGKYQLTGVTRTGCVFCMYGVHLEKGENRFERMKRTHPNLYNYCMNGGTFDDDGNWIPNKGLGMRKVLGTIGMKFD